MKIAQVTPYMYPHLGGVESHVLELSKYLKKRGHEVFIVTTLLEDTKEREIIEGVPVIRVKPLFIQLSTPVVLELEKALLKEECDIIHAHSPPPLMDFFSVRAADKKKVPFVLTYHCDLEIPNIFGPLIVQLYQRTLGTYTVNKADKIITTTHTYGATSRAVWYRDSDIIPNAVDAERFHPSNSPGNIRKKLGIEGDEHMVLYVGRIVYHKGLEHLVESASYLEDDVKYVIGGTGNFRPELEKLIKKHDLRDRIIFPGRIPNSELPKYYAAADVFVLPSVSRLEAFGIVALEAMASATPVVVSDIPGVREVITEGVHGLLSEPLNPANLAGKIRTILRNPELGEKMGKMGRKRIEENLTWDIVAEQIEKIYEDLL
ncbi:MAG: glycosyltransferase family 4 protein [Thermoplasmata archaeon]